MPNAITRYNLAPLLLLTAILALTGCRSATVEQPLTATLAANDLDTQMEFWHALAQTPITSNDDAFHGLLLYLDNKDDCADYPARVASLKSRGMLPDSFDRHANESVTRGNLAVAIVRIVQIKGGVMMRLTGAGPRYATRELVYEGIYPQSSPHQTFSGAEFVGIIGRIEDYQRSQPPADQPARVLPSESGNNSTTQPAAN